MRLTYNKNFATLFEKSPLAVTTGHECLKEIKGAVRSRCVLFNRRVPHHVDKGWVVLVSDLDGQEMGYIIDDEVG